MENQEISINDAKQGKTVLVRFSDNHKDSDVELQMYHDSFGFISDDGSVTLTYSVLREVYWTLRNQGFPG
jgi:hypothetical protein